jgi:ATP-dependent Clp protease ATP-binding subunit ClpC
MLDEVVDDDDIAEVVAAWTGIPVTQLLESEADRLLNMEDRLHERIVGQTRAVASLSDAIRRSRSGLSDPRRPMGSFIFLGSSGVGKTELAKALAEFMFDDEEALIRIDMSEYREQHTVSRLFGAPPGYIGYEQGGQLTEKIRRRPYSVVLFDEIEKAHSDVWNALLQLLDDGRLTDGQGRTVSFRNTIVIMTSNVGTSFVRRSGALGFAGMRDPDEEVEHKRIEGALKDTFKPEFLNRIDEIIIFEQLTLEDVKEIVDLQMQEVRERLSDIGLEIDLSDGAKEWLAKQGYDEDFGARPLKRAIQRYVESPLSVKLLEGDFTKGDHVLVDSQDGDLVFSHQGEKSETTPDEPEDEEEVGELAVN